MTDGSLSNAQLRAHYTKHAVICLEIANEGSSPGRVQTQLNRWQIEQQIAKAQVFATLATAYKE